MPVTGWVGAASPWAPSTSTNCFIARATWARCDRPSAPLYTRQIVGTAGVSGRAELGAAPGDVDRARRSDARVGDVGRRRALVGHGRAMHDPAVRALVPRPPAVQHAPV